MDTNNYPLPPLVVKQLNDRLYEKRKAGALEIERLLKDYALKNNTNGIEQIIRCLGKDFANASSPQPRNGGLIGLAASAIALGKDASQYVEYLVKPALNCFTDPDQRIRYYACESLYNICKVTRGSVLAYFNDIFDGLSKLADDSDGNVRNGSELLDRLIKDVVTESSSFNIPAFIPLLRERVYTRKPFCRRFIVSWISLLNTIPDINMLVYLPDILDGLFLILGEGNSEIRYMCEELLNDFSKQIHSVTEKKAQGLSEDDFSVDFPAMTNILIIHSQSKDTTIQLYAVEWLKTFLELAGNNMPQFCPGIVNSVLPILAYAEDKKNCRERARQVNQLLMGIVVTDDQRPNKLDTAALVKILCSLLQTDSMQTKIGALKWFLHLFTNIPGKVFAHVDEIFPLLLASLSDQADEVVIADLDVIAEVAKSEVPEGYEPASSGIKEEIEASLLQSVSKYFIFCIKSLLDCFRTDRVLLDEKGLFIIRHMCLLLNAESVYRTVSELLNICTDLQFCAMMIRYLNIILLTATELFTLRNTLKLVLTEEGVSLFRCLYMSWCHNPVAAVSLCLLTQQYRLASELLQHFGEIDITVELLTEVDKLVQLLESPIFIFLRLQLLDSESNHYLIKSLYSILMLLPQSEAFKTLQGRLQCVAQIHVQPRQNAQKQSFDSEDLFGHFKTTQGKHSQLKRSLMYNRSKSQAW